MGTPEAFFTVDDGSFVPGRHALGPWGAEMMNGRIVGAIAARTLERDHGDPALLPARLTVDLLRPAAMAPLTVTTSLVREGKRIRVADAEMHQNGKLVARATTVFLRRSTEPPGDVWAPNDPLQAPMPPSTETIDDGSVFMVAFSEGENGAKRHDLIWEGAERHSAWLREIRPLVEGEELTPFIRVALAGDIISPLTNWGSDGLQFINADYTIALSRLPDGPDLAMQALKHLSADGVSTGSATLFDRLGPIGTCTVIALANPTADFTITDR